MDFAPGYLIGRFFYRLFDFFHHWYIDGSRRFKNSLINFLGDLDSTFALRLTLRYFFHPLYKDYSIVGRIVGVIFRSGRIVIALCAYAIACLVFVVVYVLWLSTPLMLVLYILDNLGFLK